MAAPVGKDPSVQRLEDFIQLVAENMVTFNREQRTMERLEDSLNKAEDEAEKVAEDLVRIIDQFRGRFDEQQRDLLDDFDEFSSMLVREQDELEKAIPGVAERSGIGALIARVLPGPLGQILGALFGGGGQEADYAGDMSKLDDALQAAYDKLEEQGFDRLKETAEDLAEEDRKSLDELRDRFQQLQESVRDLTGSLTAAGETAGQAFEAAAGDLGGRLAGDLEEAAEGMREGLAAGLERLTSGLDELKSGLSESFESWAGDSEEIGRALIDTSREILGEVTAYVGDKLPGAFEDLFRQTVDETIKGLLDSISQTIDLASVGAEVGKALQQWVKPLEVARTVVEQLNKLLDELTFG